MKAVPVTILGSAVVGFFGVNAQQACNFDQLVDLNTCLIRAEAESLLAVDELNGEDFCDYTDDFLRDVTLCFDDVGCFEEDAFVCDETSFETCEQADADAALEACEEVLEAIEGNGANSVANSIIFVAAGATVAATLA